MPLHVEILFLSNFMGSNGVRDDKNKVIWKEFQSILYSASNRKGFDASGDLIF